MALPYVTANQVSKELEKLEKRITATTGTGSVPATKPTFTAFTATGSIALDASLETLIADYNKLVADVKNLASATTTYSATASVTTSTTTSALTK